MSQPLVFRKQDLLTVRQVADRLSVSHRYIYQLIERGPSHGGLMAFRFGNRRGLRIPCQDVERFKQQSRVDGDAV